MTEDNRKKYSEKLRDPRWQKKRLEILNRDNFTCQQCGEKEKTLHVHHCYYVKEVNPWDYENSSLITLCDGCHDGETAFAYNSKQLLMSSFCKRGLLSGDMEMLAGYIDTADFRLTEDMIRVIGQILSSEKYILELVDQLHTTINQHGMGNNG